MQGVSTLCCPLQKWTLSRGKSLPWGHGGAVPPTRCGLPDDITILDLLRRLYFMTSGVLLSDCGKYVLDVLRGLYFKFTMVGVPLVGYCRSVLNVLRGLYFKDMMAGVLSFGYGRSVLDVLGGLYFEFNVAGVPSFGYGGLVLDVLRGLFDGPMMGSLFTPPFVSVSSAVAWLGLSRLYNVLPRKLSQGSHPVNIYTTLKELILY